MCMRVTLPRFRLRNAAMDRTSAHTQTSAAVTTVQIQDRIHPRASTHARVRRSNRVFWTPTENSPRNRRVTSLASTVSRVLGRPLRTVCKLLMAHSHQRPLARPSVDTNRHTEHNAIHMRAPSKIVRQVLLAVHMLSFLDNPYCHGALSNVCNCTQARTASRVQIAPRLLVVFVHLHPSKQRSKAKSRQEVLLKRSVVVVIVVVVAIAFLFMY